MIDLRSSDHYRSNCRYRHRPTLHQPKLHEAEQYFVSPRFHRRNWRCWEDNTPGRALSAKHRSRIGR